LIGHPLNDAHAEMGVLHLEVAPRSACRFSSSPARSLHAALLRRLELLEPDLSHALHDAPQGAPASDHPWTISPLLGRLGREEHNLIAAAGEHYRVRVTALVPEVLAVVAAAFDPDTFLGREPLVLEHVPFDVVPQSSRWEGLSTYASLLTAARPARRITLEFHSPTGFRTRRPTGQVPPPRLCLEGYLRKWNAFAPVALPAEPLLDYAAAQLRIVSAELQTVPSQFGAFYERGVVGRVVWEAGGEAPALRRLVNVLADYALYCGTGNKTAQGMGQTVRVRR
jgi:CRISPR-associated endoribonuclease Cas6